MLTRRTPRGISAFGARPIVEIDYAGTERSLLWDSTYSQATMALRARGTLVRQPDILSREKYAAQKIAYDFREAEREARLRSYQVESSKASGEGIAIDLPYRIKSKTFRRLFGGDNVGVRVQGSIQINGNLRRQKFDELQVANQRNTNTSFRIDMVQRFTITGKIGQKVEVKVDQDSERMFDFENSLKLTYTGDEDEIVKKVEAGNVNLNLQTKLATFSGRNTGLFGLKTEAKVGALSLTGIASLERGQKNRQSPNQQEQRGQFSERDFVKNQYFWLTGKDSTYEAGQALVFVVTDTLGFRVVPNFRENYRRYVNRNHVAIASEFEIEDIKVFISQGTELSGNTQQFGRAVAMPFLQDLYDDDSTFTQDNNHVARSWRQLQLNQEYTLETKLGYIRLNQALQNQALACAFRLKGTAGQDTTSRTYGDLTISPNMRLILLKPELPSPDQDSTWNLAFRHVYYVGANNIDPNNFKLTIIRARAAGQQEETGPRDGSGYTYLQYFGFDIQGTTGGAPDGLVDNASVVNFGLGEIHFLDLTPFDPSGFYPGYENNPDTLVIWNLCDLAGASTEDTAFCAPYLYTKNPTAYQQESSIWRFQTEFKGQTSVFQLGPLVLEGSEEVTLNGRALQRGLDYTVDYMSGEMRILNEQAKATGANLEITYESGRVFQLDKTTLLGARAEYDLWQDAYVGGMVLYLNQKTLDRRVRIGNEPIRNTLWDANTSMKFKPSFLSRMVEALPLVHTTAASEVQFDAEIARVFPNPNSLENARTGDFNGLAYLDDFEGARRAIPLGLTRRMWSISSIPQDNNLDMRRGHIRWYNPNTRDQVPVKDVFPEREVNSQVANTLQSIWLSFSPDTTGGGPPERSWGGLMRYLGEGYADQSKSQYLEFWIQLPPEGRLSPDAKLLVDLGTISEDALPNDSMNSEDRPLPGQDVNPAPTQEYGNGLLSPEEDVGLDGIAGADPSDSARWNGKNYPPIPSWDNWDHGSGSTDFDRINGTEGNRNDESGGYPDTEDLDNDNNLDVINGYFSYTIDLSYQSPYIVGGQSNAKRWRLFRIPIETNDPRLRRTVGGADLTNIQWARIYLTGFSQPDSIQLVQMDIVANEWLPVTTTADTTEYVTAAVINSHEHSPGYYSPPGVEGEIDPITQLRQREQSLVLKIHELDNDSSTTPSEFFVAKNLYQDYNLLEYKRLKMFVHGGDSLEGARFADETLQLILRLSQNSDINTNYYDIITTVKPGWDLAANTIDVTLNDISMMNSRRAAAGLAAGARFAYANNPDQPGDSLVIRGSPTLSRIGYLALGVRLLNKHHRIREAEIWVDELRVSDIYKDPGTAAEVNAAVKMADLVELSGGFRTTDADFHNVNQRINATQASTESWRGNVGLNLHKFFLERWGFRFPLSASVTQTTSSPRVIPGTDTRIDPQNAPDSIRTIQNALQLRASYSKTGNSRNPFVRYTLEPLGASWDYSRDERSDYNSSQDRSEQTGAQVSYSLPTSKGNGVKPLWWARGVPVVHWLGNPSFFYKPTRMTVSMQASKRTGLRESRPTYNLTPIDTVIDGRDTTITRPPFVQRTSTWLFGTTRSFNTGFQPLNPITLDYSRSHKGVIDETGDWDNLLRFDFGRTSNVTQTASAAYSPRLLSWLNPSFSYSAGYTWANSNFSQTNAQSVSNQRSFGTDLQLDFAQILGRGGGRGGRDRDRNRPSEQNPERTPGLGDQRSPEEGDEKAPEDASGQTSQPPTIPGEETSVGKPLLPDTTEEKPSVPDSTGGKQAAADSAGVKPKPKGLSPIKALGQVLSPLKKGLLMLDPVTLSYDNTTNHQQTGTLGQARMGYQFGFSQNPGVDTDSGYVSSPSRRKQNDITARTGLRVGRDLRLTFSHAYRTQENISSTSTGTNEQTMFWLATKGGGVKSYPFVDVGADLSGLERIKYVRSVVNTMSLSSAMANKMSENWQNNASNITTRSFTQQWNPLLGINISWKADIESNIRYSSSQTFSDNVVSDNKGRQTDNQITATVTYTFRYGFKLPLLFMRPIHLQNQTSFSINTDYRKQKVEGTETGSDTYSVRQASSSWSLQPRVTYTFSNTVQGQAYVQVQQTKNDVTQSKSRLFEFGIQVNISIRG